MIDKWIGYETEFSNGDGKVCFNGSASNKIKIHRCGSLRIWY